MRIQESTRRENRPSSSNSGQKKATTFQGDRCKTLTVPNIVLTMTQELSGKSSSVHRRGIKPIVIDGQEYIHAVAFPLDGRHAISGGSKGKIRHWRVEDGKEVGTPMDAGYYRTVLGIAVSRDGKWIVSGTEAGMVAVWNAESRKKVTEFEGHRDWVQAVDISPDGTRIATASADKTLCVWSLSTGKRLLPPIKHGSSQVVDAKFSPDGCLIATATWFDFSVRVYDSQNGRPLLKVPIHVNSTKKKSESLAWASDAEQLFALSDDGNIHRLDVSTGTTLSKWLIHSSIDARCIALASNGTFIAASAYSSVSFWNTTTHEQIGSVVEFTHHIWCMAISANQDLVIAGDGKTTLRSLRDIFPSSYFDNVSAPRSNISGVRSISNHVSLC